MPASRAASSAVARWGTQRVASGDERRPQLLGEVVGAHDQHGDPRDARRSRGRRRWRRASRPWPRSWCGRAHRLRRAVPTTSSRWSAESTFGITTAAGPAAAAAAMSSAPHGVSRPLQRMVSSRLPYSPEVARRRRPARERPVLASGATASSRSKMMASAGDGLGLLQRPLVGGGHVEDASGGGGDRRTWVAPSHARESVGCGQLGIAGGQLLGQVRRRRGTA